MKNPVYLTFFDEKADKHVKTPHFRAEFSALHLSSTHFGAGGVTRTHDLLITNQLLYRLSYISIFTFGVADLILTNQLLYRLSYISIFTFGVADLILTNQLLCQLRYTGTWNNETI